MKINTLGFIGSPVLAAVFLSSSCSIGPFIQKPVASEEALGSALKALGMFIWEGGGMESVTSLQASARLTQSLQSPALVLHAGPLGEFPPCRVLSQPSSYRTRTLPPGPHLATCPSQTHCLHSYPSRPSRRERNEAVN